MDVRTLITTFYVFQKMFTPITLIKFVSQKFFKKIITCRNLVVQILKPDVLELF